MSWRHPQPVTCWQPEQADAIIPVEAEAVPEALFQATHVPLRLDQVSAKNPTSEVTQSDVTESDVLEYLLSRLEPATRATDVVPILGESGAGKSHLVRWLRNELKQRDLGDVRIIFVPKHRTSLRGVVELVLNEFPDEEELDSLRERLLSARDHDVTDAELRGRLRDALCNGLEHHAERTTVQDEKAEQARDYLAKRIPSILRDPHFAPRYLADGHAIARLVEEKRTGRRGDEAVEEPFQFTVDDVSVTVDDVTSASAAAREAANVLAADAPLPGDQRIRDLAARMLNDQLPSAIKEVFGIGGEDLRELFVEIRRSLRGRQDLILLVEDFAMFQGLQRGLVDAITLHSTQAEPLCHLLTVVAVTTGYYANHMPDTLHTRASTAFTVGAQAPDALEAFAASYLRAIRLGVGEIESRHSVGRRGPSSCDGCPVVERCHDDFGAHGDEGLFPFSPTFLRRAAEATLGEGFNARRFLTDVLRPVLVQEHQAIESGEYPTERVAERFDARRHEPAGDVMVNLRTEDEGDRRARLALLYRPQVNDGDLPLALHDAFDLSPLGRAPSTEEEGEGLEVVDTPDDRKVPAAAVPPLVAAIDTWKAKRTLSQSNRKKIRQLITDAVVARIDFTDGGYRRSAWTSSSVRPYFDTSDNANSIVIDGNRSQAKGLAEIEVSGADAAAVDAIQSLAWINARGTWRDVDNGLTRAARLELVLDKWSSDVVDQLGLREEVDDTLVAAMQALEIVAGLEGGGTVPHRRSERLARILDRHVSEGIWHEAATLCERTAKDRDVLRDYLERRLGYAQGDRGGLAAFDHRLTRIAFARSAREPDVWMDVSSGVDGPVGEALLRTAAAVERVAQLGPRLKGFTPDLAELGGDSPVEVAKRLKSVVKTAGVAQSSLREMMDAAHAADEVDLARLREVGTSLAEWEDLSLAEKTALAGGEWVASAAKINDYLTSVRRVLEIATPTGTVLGDDQRSTAEDAWVTALREVHVAAQRLRKAAS